MNNNQPNDAELLVKGLEGNLKACEEYNDQLKAALEKLATSINKLIKVDSSRLHPVDMTQRWLAVEEALSDPIVQAILKSEH